MARPASSPSLRKLLLCLLVLTLAGCGGPEPERGPESPEQDTDPQGVLRGALLEAGDLPPGWERVDPGAGTDDVTEGESGFCGEPIPEVEEAAASASVQFAKGELTTRLVESVVAYESPEEATAAFDEVERAVQACREWDVEADDTVTTFTLSSVPFPNVADETLGAKVSGRFRVSGEAAGGAPGTDGFVEGDTVVVRHQSYIVVIRHFTIGLAEPPSLASADTEPAVRRAVEKVMQVGPMGAQTP